MAYKQVIGGLVQVPSGGGGGSQTPWTTDIDAAGFSIKNIGIIYAPDGTTVLMDLTAIQNTNAGLSFDSGKNAYFIGDIFAGFILSQGAIQADGNLTIGGATSLANGACTIDPSGNVTAPQFIGNLTSADQAHFLGYSPGNGWQPLAADDKISSFNTNNYFNNDGFVGIGDGLTFAGNLYSTLAFLSSVLSGAGITPVVDGTYTVGLGVSTNGTITTQSGLITAITQAS